MLLIDAKEVLKAHPELRIQDAMAAAAHCSLKTSAKLLMTLVLVLTELKLEKEATSIASLLIESCKEGGGRTIPVWSPATENHKAACYDFLAAMGKTFAKAELDQVGRLVGTDPYEEEAAAQERED
ncbi:MAG: hypothetical protein KAJ73_00745 [Zetaproteobacteria bacterium]|nr:hypothetical protein [Zetaproteobacteria bacterium]